MGLLTTKNEDTFLCGNKFKISSSIQSNQTSWDQINKFAQRNSMKDTSSLWTIKPGLMFVCRMSPLYSNIVDCTRVWGHYFFDHLSGKCTIPHRIPSLQKKVGFLQYYVWRVRSSTWLMYVVAEIEVLLQRTSASVAWDLWHMSLVQHNKVPKHTSSVFFDNVPWHTPLVHMLYTNLKWPELC